MKVVLDTNILVAAAFNDHSSSAQIVRAIEFGEIELVWDAETRAESRRVLEQIPPISWSSFDGLFTEQREFRGATDRQHFEAIQDRSYRKFAALANATGAVLVSNDEHLLSVRRRLDITILTPGELINQSIDEN